MTKLAKSFAAPRFPRLEELKRGWRCEDAAQIVEFAISLPLLVLLVVGIFDFSNALTLKQRLTNAAREAARVAAADPANDLGSPSTPVPASVGDAFQVADNYLISEKINDCGLSGPPPAAPAVAGLTWTYTAKGNGCPGNGITLVINRGCTNPTGTLTLIGTCVTITYAYKWEYNSVANSLGWTASGPNTLTVTAVAPNEN
jgi:TadE-like protein